MKKIMIISILSILFLLSACSAEKVEATEQAKEDVTTTTELVDVLGRKIEMPDKVERVVVTGVGALRLYAYAGDLEKLVGVESIEQGKAIGRPYTLINKTLFESLPVIGQGGPSGGNDAERILTVKPDVIFTTYENPDELQNTLGIPVVALGYGVNAVFDESVYQSLSIIGEVVGTKEHALNQVQYLKACKADLEARTADIDLTNRPSIYVGAIGSKGAHGIESTRGANVILDVIEAKNVVDETDHKGAIMVDKEKLLEWNPDYIFIDMNGFTAVLEDYDQNPEFYQSLSAVKTDMIFGQMPYNFLTTNIDTAIADAYFIGKTIYPDQFADIDPAVKADEIYTQLLEGTCYDQMVSDFGGFRALGDALN